MNDELQAAMTDFVNKINNGSGIISEKAPLAIEQFITWSLLGHWLIIIGCVTLFSLSFGGPFYLYHKSKKHHRENVKTDDPRHYLVLTSLLFIPSLLGVVVNIISIIKISFFTEWYLVQEASKLIN